MSPRYHALYAGTALVIAAAIVRGQWGGSVNAIILAALGILLIIGAFAPDKET